MKLLSRLREHSEAVAPAARTPRDLAQLIYSRDEFLDPSDPAEFEPVLCEKPLPAAERLS